jgi:xylulose-5-phosphate/fructose-6-phosphate phosphoketolase
MLQGGGHRLVHAIGITTFDKIWGVPGATLAGNVPTLGNFLREVTRLNMQNFRVFGPDETQSNRLEALYYVTQKVWLAEYFPEDADGGNLAPEGRVMEMLSEHTVEGWLEGYP